jgi:hypothetical protein
MRTIARDETGRGSTAAPPAPEYSCASGLWVHSAECAGRETKVGFTSLLPGGMTQDAKIGIIRILHANSPEPVIGFGAGKGTGTEYRPAHSLNA